MDALGRARTCLLLGTGAVLAACPAPSLPPVGPQGHVDETGYDHGWTPQDTGEETSDTGSGSTDTGDTADSPGGDPVGTGYLQGDVAYDLQAADQEGVNWALYDQVGAPVVLVFGYGQSWVFQSICDELPELASQYPGVVFSVMLMLDSLGAGAIQEDAALWAEAWDLPVVLWDRYDQVNSQWAFSTQVRTYVLDQDMVIVRVLEEAFDPAQLETLLDSL